MRESNPSFDCIARPDSLSNRNSLHYLYEGGYESKYSSGHLLRQLEAASRGEQRC